MQHTLICPWKRTVATAKGMQDADIPTSAIAKLTNKRCNWFRMERFQNTTRHTEMLPRIPMSVVIPSNIPTIRIMPDNGMLHTADADAHSKVVWSLEPDKQFTTGYLILLYHLSFCLFIYLSVCMERQNCLIVLNSIIYGIYFITLGASRCIFDAFYMRWGAKLIIFGSNTITFGAFSIIFDLNTIIFGSNTITFGAFSIMFGSNTTIFGAFLIIFGSSTIIFGAFFIIFSAFSMIGSNAIIFATFVVMIVTNLPSGRRVCR